MEIFIAKSAIDLGSGATIEAFHARFYSKTKHMPDKRNQPMNNSDHSHADLVKLISRSNIFL